MSLKKLSDIPLDSICAILLATEGLPHHTKKERMYRWALDHGENISLVEELLEKSDHYKESVEDYKKLQAKLWKEKLVKDEEDKKKAIKEGRWDDKHNCETAPPNTDDPLEKRFRHNAGSDTSRDVTWKSSTPGTPDPESKAKKTTVTS